MRPPALHDLDRLPKTTRVAPPSPSRPGPQKDKDGTPQLFTIWSGPAPQKDKNRTPQPFTSWSGLKGQGWDPPTLHALRFGVVPQINGYRTPQPFTIWQLFPSRNLTADFLLPNSAYNMCHLHWAVAPAQPHRKPIAFSGTRQDSLTESLHESPPAQPHRKPNPERNRLTESPHAVLLSILPGPRWRQRPPSVMPSPR